MQKRSDNDSTAPKAQQEPQCPYRSKTVSFTFCTRISQWKNVTTEMEIKFT